MHMHGNQSIRSSTDSNNNKKKNYLNNISIHFPIFKEAPNYLLWSLKPWQYFVFFLSLTKPVGKTLDVTELYWFDKFQNFSGMFNMAIWCIPNRVEFGHNRKPNVNVWRFVCRIHQRPEKKLFLWSLMKPADEKSDVVYWLWQYEVLNGSFVYFSLSCSPPPPSLSLSLSPSVCVHFFCCCSQVKFDSVILRRTPKADLFQ